MAMRQVYLAATGMNRGKTTFALGLLAAMLERGLSTGFTKPVGQRYALVGDIPADEDAILVRDTFGLDDRLEDMSPVHLPRGFTKRFIRGGVAEDLGARIVAAHGRLSARYEALLVEGTGHAGVGAVVGLSNAHVAARLGVPAIIISEGGVGRPIDEIVLNRALFAQHGVPLLGAVVNKVKVDRDPSLPETLERGLGLHGIPLLGVLPYRTILANPTLTMLIEQMHGELLHPGDDMDRHVEHVAIGASQPRNLLAKIGPGSLLIVAGDRGDIIHAVIAANNTQRAINREPGLWDRLRGRSRFGRVPDDPSAVLLAGLVFTGGQRPRERDLEAIRNAGIFAYMVEDEAYAVASQIHDLLVKTHSADTAKIEVIKRIVAESFDVDGLLDRLDGAGTGSQGRTMASVGPMGPMGPRRPGPDGALDAGLRRLVRATDALRASWRDRRR